MTNSALVYKTVKGKNLANKYQGEHLTKTKIIELILVRNIQNRSEVNPMLDKDILAKILDAASLHSKTYRLKAPNEPRWRINPIMIAMPKVFPSLRLSLSLVVFVNLIQRTINGHHANPPTASRGHAE